MKKGVMEIVGYNCGSGICSRKPEYPKNTMKNYCAYCGEQLHPIKRYLLPEVKKNG